MAEAAEDIAQTTGSTIVRAAEWFGRTLGQWRRERAGRRDDAYIKAWKGAWTEGCEARWHGAERSPLPYKRNPQKDAWTAGWLWADTQPDRRDSSHLASHWPTGRRAGDQVSGSNQSLD
jgi:hypothetical protein